MSSTRKDNSGSMGKKAGRGAVESGEKATSLRYKMMDLAKTKKDVISLGRGDPDLHTQKEIIDGAMKYFASSAERDVNSDDSILGPIRGLPDLKRKIADRFLDEKGISVDPERELLITNGAQEGLFLALLALVDPGDKVACPDPRYTSYDQAIGACGGTIVSIPTQQEGRFFELKEEDLVKHASGAKLLVFVNPSNPTGSCATSENVRNLAQVAKDLGMIVLSDEIYEDIVFENHKSLCFWGADGARDRSVVLSGFSKSYAMTGFRVGFLVGPPAFIDAVSAIKETTSGPCPTFSQYAALAALEMEHDSRPQFLSRYQDRRQVLMDGFDSIGVPYAEHYGGLFLWADMTRFGIGAEEFCYRLLRDAGVLMFPGNSFGESWENWVRVSLLAPKENIEEAIVRMAEFVERLEGNG
jgi:aminotransferase